MSSTTTNLKNINFMSESKYNSLTEIHDDELYAVKVNGLDGEQLINQNPNENPVKVWTGTQEEYDALSEYDASTIYNITDGVGGDTIATTNGNNTFTGTNNFVTPSLNDNTTKAATTAWVNSVVNNKMSLTLLDYKWTDHILNNISWLRADTFSWQDGGVYEAAYNHLVDDYNSGTSTTETVGSYTITYRLASDGHKITTDETNVANIYNESGVAWYYILDTNNQRFKLPRENPAREELIQVIRAKGNGIALGLYDGTNNVGMANIDRSAASFIGSQSTLYGKDLGTQISQTWDNGGVGWSVGITADSTKSGIISDMKDSTSVYKGKKYLYFYVGNYSQSATEQTAGLNSELFNEKADIDLSNAALNASASAKQTIASWGIPDYSTGISISLTNNVELEWTAPYNCFIRVSGSGSSASDPGIARIRTKDNVDIVRVDITVSSVSNVGTFVAAGEKVKLYARSTNVGGIYYALKGN